MTNTGGREVWGDWQVFSGGYLWFVGKGDEYIGDGETQETLIHLPELCQLSEKIVREKLNYAPIDLKELHDISSAFLVYRTRKGVQNKQNIVLSLATDDCEMFRVNGIYYDYTGQKSFRNRKKLEKIFDKIPFGQ